MGELDPLGRQVLGDVTRHATPHLLGHAHRRTDLAGRAVAALETVVLDERPLQRVRLVLTRQPLDGDDVPTHVLHRQRETGHDALAVDKDRAGAARALVAALLRAVELERFAEQVEQRNTRVGRRVNRGSVDPNREVLDDHRSTIRAPGHTLNNCQFVLFAR